ncbi:putative nucleoredoxin 1 [Castanea sativa]|uniref:putative nucleoredoxin 1 n=1 Tax=Castanea sativa TaxID=21020 RepID=UPI003F64D97B
MEGEGVSVLDCEFQCDVKSLLPTPQRDFLIRNNGEQVETYNEFSPRGEFKVVYSSRFDYGTFHEELSYMPWLAVPNTEHETQMRIWEELKMAGIVNIVIVDASGKVLCKNAFEAVKEYGIEAYPFTPQRIKEIEEQAVAAQKDQSLMSLFVLRSLDFVITNDDQKVPVSELDGKMVGLHIRSVERPLFEFTPSLVEVYKILKERGENFEIVFDSRCKKLARYFGFKPTTMYHTPARPPILVIIGSDGKILNQNAAEVVEEHGVEAYPFTLERLAELEEVGKAKQETQMLKSLLVSGNHDFLLGDGDTKVPVSDFSSKKMVPVSDLVGKTILLDFLERCSENADSIVQELTELYDEIKEKDDAFEMILVPNNIDCRYDLNYYPPCSTETVFIVLGPTGLTLRKEDAWDILTTHGAEAFPFTDDHLRDIEARFVQMAKDWPEEELHSEYCEAVTRTYDIVLTRKGSHKCSMRRLCKIWPNEYARGWTYFCKEFNFYLHPECALKDYLKNIVKEDEVYTTEQSLRSAFCSCSCDFLISHNRNKVPISEGKIVGLYFFSSRYKTTTEKDDFYCEVINLYENSKKRK